VQKLAAIQMIDIGLPTTDCRTVVLSRHTEPEIESSDPAAKLVLSRHTEPEIESSDPAAKLDLPAQPPPKIIATNPN